MKFNRVLGLKMKGEDIKFVQTKLKEFGFYTERIDGYFGQNLLIAVVNFQKKVNIKTDGVVGMQTWSNIVHYNDVQAPIIVKTLNNDIPHQISYTDTDGLKIYDCLLNDDEYIKEETNKNTIWLHHTAGGSRPDWTIGGWEKDYDVDEDGNQIPIKVATHYVIGRKSSTDGGQLWDGKILRAFDDKYWAWHLGLKKAESLNSRSISIEVCNYGPLTIGKDGRFYNWVNKPIEESNVVKLDSPFRGYEYWEKYTDNQIESLRKLILYLQKKWGIDIDSGIYNEDWFEYNEVWKSLGGLRTHTQVRNDKFDLFPQKEMIQMLNSL